MADQEMSIPFIYHLHPYYALLLRWHIIAVVYICHIRFLFYVQ